MLGILDLQTLTAKNLVEFTQNTSYTLIINDNVFIFIIINVFNTNLHRRVWQTDELSTWTILRIICFLAT